MYKPSYGLGPFSLIPGCSSLLPLTLKMPCGKLVMSTIFLTLGLVSRIVSFQVVAFIKTEGGIEEEITFILGKNKGKNNKTKHCLSS